MPISLFCRILCWYPCFACIPMFKVWQTANTPRYQNKRLQPTVTWSSLIKLRNTQTHRLLYKWWWQTCNLLRSSETNVTGALVFKYVSISYTSTMHQQTHIQDGNTTHNHELNLFTTKERLILGDVKRVWYFTFTLEMELILVSRKSAHRATLSNGSRLTSWANSLMNPPFFLLRHLSSIWYCSSIPWLSYLFFNFWRNSL